MKRKKCHLIEREKEIFSRCTCGEYALSDIIFGKKRNGELVSAGVRREGIS